MDSKSNGAWDDILGANNSSIVKTNANGEFFLKFCSEKKLKIKNFFVQNGYAVVLGFINLQVLSRD